MGVELIDPTPGFRGTFQARYAQPQDRRTVDKYHRLGDLLLVVAATDDPQYMTAAQPGEFAVVDVLTKEKAWFEMPHGCSPAMVTAMVESHFNSTAFRVGDKLWFV